MRGVFAGLAIAAMALSGCVSPPATDPSQIADGRAIAQRACASCHALDMGVSPRPGAPPMRDMLARYPADVLAADLIQGIRIGHEEMPLFDLDVRSADALVIYLRSLRAR